MELLGLLVSSARDRIGSYENLEPSPMHTMGSQEPVLDLHQLRIYVVPLLEYLLAADPLGVRIGMSTTCMRCLCACRLCRKSCTLLP
jgi:hypothetical protein